MVQTMDGVGAMISCKKSRELSSESKSLLPLSNYQNTIFTDTGGVLECYWVS